MSFSSLYTNVKILKLGLNRGGSQWSDISAGVTWSFFLARQISRAAARLLYALKPHQLFLREAI